MVEGAFPPSPPLPPQGGGSPPHPSAAALYKLHAWLSPAYPVGAYTYSHGLEWAISDGQVRDAATARQWIGDCLTEGAGRTDAILLAYAWRAEDREALDAVSDLATALAPAAERLLEAEAQGAAFAEVTDAAWGRGERLRAPYAVAVGAAARAHDIALGDTLAVYCQAFVSNLVSAAVRLVPLGQTEGAGIVATLLPQCLATAHAAEAAPLDDIGGCALRSDIAAMRHETMETRLFRS